MIVISAVVLLINLFLDIVYGVIDPRITAATSRSTRRQREATTATAATQPAAQTR
jgi:hypothetical protein